MTHTFVLKNPRETDSLVYLILREGTVRANISTGIFVPVKSWNQQTLRMKRNHALTSECNHTLDRIATETNRLNHIARTKERLTEPKNVFSFIRRQLITSGCLNRSAIQSQSDGALRAYEAFIEDKRASSKPNTILMLKTTYNVLKANVSPSTALSELITEKTAQRIFSYLSTRYTNNTFRKHLAIIKRFLHWAVKKGLVQGEAFVELYKSPDEIGEAQTTLFALTQDELTALENLELPRSTVLDKVRDTFLLSVYTGLRHSDVVRLARTHVVDGAIRITPEKNSKNNATITIPIHPRLRAVLDKYPDFNFYKCSNQKANGHIKEVGALARLDRSVTDTKRKGIETVTETKPLHDMLSWHCARRTFITLSLQKGVTPDVVMKVSGHTTSKSFSKYIKHSDEHVSSQINKAWE